jgi:putative membrane protein
VLAGFALIYAATLTRLEYLAQHMFFLNRIQQVTLGAVAPFLIGLGWPRAEFAAGIPAALLRPLAGRRVRALALAFRFPPTAALLWVAVTDLWLIPSVHFAAMLDPLLYQTMNLAMIGAGLWFWTAVLDPRPRGEAGSSYLTRMAAGFLVMFPQILVASSIAFASVDLYSFYALCGRFYPAIAPLQDQLTGGIIQWFPPGALNTAVLFVQLGAIRRSEDEASREVPVPPGARVIEARWTGR